MKIIAIVSTLLVVGILLTSASAQEASESISTESISETSEVARDNQTEQASEPSIEEAPAAEENIPPANETSENELTIEPVPIENDEEVAEEIVVIEEEVIVDEVIVTEGDVVVDDVEIVADVDEEVMVNEAADGIVPAAEPPVAPAADIVETGNEDPRVTSEGRTPPSGAAEPCLATPDGCSPDVTTPTTACHSCTTTPPCVNGSTDCPSGNESEILEANSGSGDAPLFAPWKFNKIIPAASTLEAPAEVEATFAGEGPDPKIVARADGRHKEVPVVLLAPTPTQTPISGFFTGANLPWLGLLVLLIFGIVLWRKKGE